MFIIDCTNGRVGFVPPCRVQVLLPAVALLLVMLFQSNPAAAHDPGLSAAELRINEQSIRLKMTFSRRDIELLFPLDLNADGIVSDQEMAKSEQQLKHLASNFVEITVDAQAQNSLILGVTSDASDAVVFSLEFVRPICAEFQFNAPIVKKMALGHRQFVTVLQDGIAIQTEILSVAKTAVAVRLTPMVWWRQILRYVWEGIWHIWIGFDHILFLIAMLLPAALLFSNGVWRPRDAFKPTCIQVLKIVSAFTVAHSITLSLSVFNLVRLDVVLVESVIAASVIFAAANNLRPSIREHLWMMSFAFGLIHGLGFASVLADLGLPDEAKGSAILGFNMGVEIGQLAIIAVLLPMIFIFRGRKFYKPLCLDIGSVAIAGIASIWLLERIAGWNLLAAILPLA